MADDIDGGRGGTELLRLFRYRGDFDVAQLLDRQLAQILNGLRPAGVRPQRAKADERDCGDAKKPAAGEPKTWRARRRAGKQAVHS